MLRSLRSLRAFGHIFACHGSCLRKNRATALAGGSQKHHKRSERYG
jgi:hypothetical protein